MKYITSIDGQEFTIELLDDRRVSVDGRIYEVDFLQVGDQPVYSLLLDGVSYDALVYPDEDQWQVTFQGEMYIALVEDEREKRLRATMGMGVSEQQEFFLKAPMPGLVVAVPVVNGQPVEKGDVLLVLESMKMQNELRAPRNGTVNRIRVKAGDRVEKKETLLSVA
jgi:biotin carboxyl carrier protein